MMNEPITAIAHFGAVVEEFGLTALRPLLQVCRALGSHDAPLDVAVFGQFKSGKSSLLNAIIGRPLLPVGAIPVTAVVTRVAAGDGHASVTRLDGGSCAIPADQVASYVSESANPDNFRRVELVDVEAPELHRFPGLRLVDTPGLGSVHAHNTKATRDWLPGVAVALVVVSAERPLSEEDRSLVRELVDVAPRVVVILSKIDVVSREERDEVQAFMADQLRASLGRDLPIIPFSTREDPGYHVSRLETEVFAPLCANATAERQSVLELKLATLSRSCEAYLEAALSAAKKDEGERKALLAAVFDESVSEPLARDELRLAAQRVVGSTRAAFERRFLGCRAAMAPRIAADLGTAMRGWGGNLAQQLAQYEAWMIERIGAEMAALMPAGEPVADDLVSQAEERFRRIGEALRGRLARNLTLATGVTLPTLAWQPTRSRVAVAPVAIGRTLDTQWALLSWAIPMSVFGGVFRRHCVGKVEWEVEKNLTRLAGSWSDSTVTAITDLEEHAARWIHDELLTLKGVLGRADSESDRIGSTLRGFPDWASRRSADPAWPPARQA